MFRGTILVIDKYNGMNTLTAGFLTASGFQVECLRSPEQLTDRHLSTVHLTLLDLETAGGQLGGILERFNAAGIPVLVLTSEQDLSGRLTALQLGAADVMSRPVDLAELTARIRAAQSRTQITTPFVNRPVAKYKGLTADISKYKATLDGEPLDIPPKEVALLYLLISSPGRVCTRAELSRQLMSSGSDRTINLHISRLKKHIGRYADHIVSVRSVGYKFTE